jgi:hypothetical protein
MTRLVVPFPHDFFNPGELYNMQFLAIPPEWMIELSLALWKPVFVDNDHPGKYEVVVQEIHELYVGDNVVRAEYLREWSDYYVDIIDRLMNHFRVYLGHMPAEQTQRELDTVVVDNFLPGAIVLRLVFVGEDHISCSTAWVTYPRAFTDEAPTPRYAHHWLLNR